MFATNESNEFFVLYRADTARGLWMYFRLTKRYTNEHYSTRLDGLLYAPTSTTQPLSPVQPSIVPFEQRVLAETLLQNEEHNAAWSEVYTPRESVALLHEAILDGIWE